MEKVVSIFLLLCIQLVAAGGALLSFQFIEPKKIAALVAGALFVGFGFAMIHLTRKWEEYRTYLSYWCIRIHVFIFAIPMFLGRVIFWEKDLSEIVYFSIPGPKFHDISKIFYSIMLVCTLIDLLIAWLKRKKN